MARCRTVPTFPSDDPYIFPFTNEKMMTTLLTLILRLDNGGRGIVDIVQGAQLLGQSLEDAEAFFAEQEREGYIQFSHVNGQRSYQIL